MSAEAKTLLELNRKDNGRFGHQLHGVDPSVSVGAEGPAWPESFPEPVIEMHLGDTGQITTEITVGGEMFSSTYNRWDDKDDIETDMYVPSFDHSDEDSEQAEEWATAQHKKIAAQLREVTEWAFDAAKHAAVARATGKPVELTDSDLHELARENAVIARQAARDAFGASACLVARGIKANHPEAVYLSLDFSGDDRASHVDVLDEKRRHIVTYYANEDEVPWSASIPRLNLEQADAWDTSGMHGERSIRLDQASSWSPGQ